jgi:hypothetical protein
VGGGCGGCGGMDGYGWVWMGMDRYECLMYNIYIDILYI